MEGVKPVSRWSLGWCDAVPRTSQDKDPRQSNEDTLVSLFEDSQQQLRSISRLEARVASLELRLGAVEKSKASSWGDDGDSETLDSGALDYTIGESVWDAPLIAGLKDLGVGASLLLFASLLLNAVVQVFICTKLLSNPSFTGRSFGSLTEAAERWRDREGHQSSAVDASGISLVSRLCFQDAALSVAGAQSTLLAEINVYHDIADQLGVETDSFGFATGPTLCAVCIFLHSVVVMSELRKLRDQLFAVCALPRGFTQVEDGNFIAISGVRLLCVVLTGLVRGFVALALLYTGVKWLSSTSSVSDMILNAAALGFIMDLDEHLFDMAAPAVVKNFRSQLKPLRVNTPPYLLESLVPLLGVLAVVAASTVGLVLPVAEEMIAVKRALCGGNLDFAVVENPANFIIVRDTVPFYAQDVGHPATLRVKAVQEYKALDLSVKGNLPQLSMRSNSDWSFNRDSQMSVESLNEVMAACFDIDSNTRQDIVATYPFWFNAIREHTGHHAGLSLQEVPFSCQDYFSFCDQSPLLRSRCPLTCGCNDRSSGLVLAEPQQGCPQVCIQDANSRARQQSCNDSNASGTPEWARYWKSYAETLSLYYGNSSLGSALQSYANHKNEAGCGDDMPDPVLRVHACESMHPVYQLNGIRSISGFCPQKCCVRLANRSFTDLQYCPTSCQR